MRVALCIITIGDASRKAWEETFAPSVRAYADRCGYELRHYTAAFDHETTRHAAWQKLLLAEQPDLAGFDRIIHIDHDVMISPAAPPIAETVPDGRIGAVTWQGSIGEDPLLRRLHEVAWKWNTAKWVSELNPTCFADLLEAAGYPRTEDHCNAGVFVCAPCHGPALRNLYETGISNERSSLEQAALTDFLCRSHCELLHPLDRRFNVVWDFEKIAYYPFLDELYPTSTIIMHCLAATLARCWFLHFAGGGVQREWARNFVKQAHLRSVA